MQQQELIKSSIILNEKKMTSTLLGGQKCDVLAFENII